MKGFKLITPENKIIRFGFYNRESPVTCSAFEALLPFNITLVHARVSGHEIWSAEAPPLDIIQENASVFAEPGEAVYGPLHPKRAKTSNCIGIYYGEGRGLDSCNIFAKVFEVDMEMLQQLGEDIWKKGSREIRFEKLD